MLEKEIKKETQPNNKKENVDFPKKTIRARIKKAVFDNELYNRRSIIFKMTASGIFLALAVGLSAIELFDVPMPWGATFGVRFFDTLILVYAISIVGLGFALLDGMALPWIHNAIDGHHTWVEMAFFMVSNMAVILIAWFIYYILFNAYYKTRVEENVNDHSIHEYHFVTIPHDHHHRFFNLKWTKKIAAFLIIVPLSAVVEALCTLLVAKILLATGAHSEHNEGLDDLFQNAKNVLTFLGIFFGIFMAKYSFTAIIFLLLEKRTRALIDRFGIYS